MTSKAHWLYQLYEPMQRVVARPMLQGRLNLGQRLHDTFGKASFFTQSLLECCEVAPALANLLAFHERAPFSAQQFPNVVRDCVGQALYHVLRTDPDEDAFGGPDVDIGVKIQRLREDADNVEKSLGSIAATHGHQSFSGVASAWAIVLRAACASPGVTIGQLRAAMQTLKESKAHHMFNDERCCCSLSAQFAHNC